MKLIFDQDQDKFFVYPILESRLGFDEPGLSGSSTREQCPCSPCQGQCRPRRGKSQGRAQEERQGTFYFSSKPCTAPLANLAESLPHRYAHMTFQSHVCIAFKNFQSCSESLPFSLVTAGAAFRSTRKLDGGLAQVLPLKQSFQELICLSPTTRSIFLRFSLQESGQVFKNRKVGKARGLAHTLEASNLRDTSCHQCDNGRAISVTLPQSLQERKLGEGDDEAHF